MARDVKLPSGAKLQVNLAPFSESDELFQAFCKEIKDIKLDFGAEIDMDFFKSMVCAGVASKDFRAALKKVMGRCLYNGMVVSDDTFEPEAARVDFIPCCVEIAKENILPFTKGLYALSSLALGLLGQNPA